MTNGAWLEVSDSEPFGTGTHLGSAPPPAMGRG
jgi:hypothetical protein